MRASAPAGSQSISSLASPKCRRILARRCAVDRGERLGDGVDEGVAADEAAARVALAPARSDVRRRRSRFPAAHRRALVANSARRSAGAGLLRSSARRGSSVSNSAACRGLQRMTLAPAEEGALRHWCVVGSCARLSETSNGRHKAAMPECSMPRFRGMTRVESQVYFTALLIAAARSVFSQEKPPSLSGARPKWP